MGIAHQTANNATENNFLPTALLALTAAGTAYEGYQIYQTYQKEGPLASLTHLGISVATTVVGGVVVSNTFKVGKALYPTLKEAYNAALKHTPMLKASLGWLEKKLTSVEQVVTKKMGAETPIIKETKTLEKEFLQDEVSTFKKTKDQPWTIRPGQEWKEKIYGKGQTTGTDGHAMRCYREAIDVAKKEDVTKVVLNRGAKGVTEYPIGKPNGRPDVLYQTKDGKWNQIEVPSKTDHVDVLKERMIELRSRLPEHMKGETDIRYITKGDKN